MSANKPTSIFQEKLSQEKLNELKKIQTEKAAELLRAGKSPQEVAEKLCVPVKYLAVLLMDSGMSSKETAEMMGLSIRELSLLLSKGNAAKSHTTSVKPSISAEGQKKETPPPVMEEKYHKPAANCKETESIKDRIVLYAFLEGAKTLDKLNKINLWRCYLSEIDSWVQKMLPEIEQTPEMDLVWATLALAMARKKVDPDAK